MVEAISSYQIHDSRSLTDNSIQKKRIQHSIKEGPKPKESFGANKIVSDSVPQIFTYESFSGNNHAIYEYIPRYRQKGFIFLLPVERKFRHIQKLVNLLWLLAHGMYILHLLNLFPSETANYLRPPPWEYKVQAKKFQSKDYIIEPDWDS